MRLSPAAPSRAYRAVVDQVCDAIMSGDLHVGDMLPAEREIVAQVGISRSSVREALKVLADAGLVAIKPGGGGGTRVIRDVIPVELLGRAMEMSRKRIVSMLEVRNALDLTAAEMAAMRADPSFYQSLDDTVEQMESVIRDHLTDYDLFRTVDTRFHLLVVKASGNDVLLQTYRPFARQAALALDMIGTDDILTLELPTMKSLIQAIKKQNPASARLAMSSHVYPLLSIAERFFEGDSVGTGLR